MEKFNAVDFECLINKKLYFAPGSNSINTLISIHRYTRIPQTALMKLVRCVQSILTNLSVAQTHIGVKLLCVLSKGEGLKNI